MKKRIKPGAKSAPSAGPSTRKDACWNCSRNLGGTARALFVEEEVGRIFCSESCITNFFSPEIKRLEKEYFRQQTPGDLSGDDREKFAHLRWATLQEPMEVWREKTVAGDYRFTLISEFKPHDRSIWSICICLFLKGEPSFLYLAFPTKNAALANFYRRGERIEWKRGPVAETEFHPEELESPQPESPVVDSLADGWTEDETIRATLSSTRSPDDIPFNEYSLYQSCLSETIEGPDEVWSLMTEGLKKRFKLYHFIKFYAEESQGVWYIVIARQIEDEEKIEILDAFPTRDVNFVERFRTGEQEVGSVDEQGPTRVVH